MREKISKVVRNGGWMAGSQLFDMAIRFFSVPLLLACYGRANYGLIAIVVSVQGYLGILSLGTPDGLVKYAAEWLHRGNTRDLYACARTILTFYTVLGIISAAVLTILGISCAGLFHISGPQQSTLRNMFILTAGAMLVLSPAQLITQLLKAAEEFHFLSKCAIARSVLDVLWVVGAVLWQVRLDYFLAVRLAIPLLTIPVFLKRWSRHGSIRRILSFGWDWIPFRPVMRYGCAMLAMGWCYTTFLQLRQVLLGTRSTVEAAAEFSIILAVTNVLTMAGAWIVGPLVPSVAKALAGGEGEYVEFVAYRMTKYFWILLCLPAVWIAVGAEPILRIYVGPQYVGLAPWLVVMMLCVLDTFLAPLGGIIFASGKLRPYVWSNAIFGMVGLALVWLLAPRLGVSSAVWATVWFFMANCIFHFVYYVPVVMKLDPWRLFREAFLRPLLPAGLTACVMLAVKAAAGGVNAWATLGMTFAFGVPCYLGLIWLISLEPYERLAVAKAVDLLRRWVSIAKSSVG